MRYSKKIVDSDWPLDENRVQRKLIRVRRREGPLSARVTRKLVKVDAELLARAAGVEPLASLAPTAPPPAPPRVLVPPALPIAFPFPFANAASPVIATRSEDDYTDVHDSWLLPPPREPDPFTLRPPSCSPHWSDGAS